MLVYTFFSPIARGALLKNPGPEYALAVTIVSRRRIYWILFILSLALFAGAFVLSIPLFTAKAAPAFLKAAGAFKEAKVFGLTVNSASSSAAAVLATCLFSAVSLGYILFSFRKTVSPEIFFFSFWVLSLGCEAGRLLVFRFASEAVPVGWILLASRAVFGARILGLLCFFAAGLHAAGFRNEKLGSALGVILVAGWALAEALPFDTGVYETTLALRSGFSTLSLGLACLTGLGVVANLAYASFSSGEKSYKVVAMGASSALLGQLLLLTRWYPLVLVLGVFLLFFGSWLFISRLHAYYLWQ